jgi:murein DD-endopeptidase MepM/ murein hydrolase activator NlpD
VTCFIALLFLVSSAWAASPQIVLSSHTLQPGQTLRVEVDGLSPDAKLRVLFNKKSYPCYPVGPNAQRALIGVPLGTPPQSLPLALKSADPDASSSPLAYTAVSISSRNYPTENINFSQAKTSLAKNEHRESALIHRKAAILRKEQSWEGTFLPPVSGPSIAPFGLHRTRNGTQNAGFHKGMDFRSPKGAPVLASNAGIVELAAPLKAHGKTILLNHGQGVMTIYLHMSSLRVKPGQKVTKGQIIGKVGSTGLSTAPHVHWQVFVHGVPVDPKQWMETEF